jgi:hypothetical protein
MLFSCHFYDIIIWIGMKSSRLLCRSRGRKLDNLLFSQNLISDSFSSKVSTLLPKLCEKNSVKFLRPAETGRKRVHLRNYVYIPTSHFMTFYSNWILMISPNIDIGAFLFWWSLTTAFMSFNKIEILCALYSK